MREAAREIAAEVEQSVARLQREQPELEKRLAEKQAQLDLASLAPKRLANYVVRVGADYQCPRCWIYEEKRSRMLPRPGPPRQDIFECVVCGRSVVLDH